MNKNIIVCSDGTGNTSIKGRGTNVFKLFEAVDTVGHIDDGRLKKQIAIYDDGVGTEKLKLFRIFGGAFGFGLARNVRQLYTEIARSYKAGDQIYMFGFSRGAFTVRTLAGFINHAGIVDPKSLTSHQLSAKVGELYRAYRKGKPAILEQGVMPINSVLRSLWKVIKKPFSPKHPESVPFDDHPVVSFVGVWDTVDAVGFPIPGIAWLWNHGVHRFKFTNRSLPECVRKACHALAIDEERASFSPFLWTHDPDRIEQVWFAGVHSNVGGGYPKQGMSLVTLDWMMAHAETAGDGSLRFVEELRATPHKTRNVHDCLYDSRSGLGTYYRYRPRDIGAICAKAEVEAPVRIHHSALGRIEERAAGYAPGNLPDEFEVVATPKESEKNLPRLGPVRLASGKMPAAPVAGAAGLWTRWRQGVQVLFYAVQIAIVSFAVTRPRETVLEQLPPAPGQDATLAQKLISWLQQVAEAAVAPVPGSFVQDYVVQPLFAYPMVGLGFLLCFPLCYFLGLLGRLRIESINSHAWRHMNILKAARTSSPGPRPSEKPSADRDSSTA